MPTILLILLTFFSINTSSAELATEEQAQLADPPWYQVEVVVFEHLTPESLQGEDWPSHPELPSLNNAIELQPTTDDNLGYFQSYQLLPTDYLAMGKAVKRLASKGNPILAHMAWMQPLDPQKTALPIHLTGGRNLEELHDDSHVFGFYTTPTTSEVEHWEVDGTVSVSQERYVNFQANLVFNKPTDELLKLNGSLADNPTFKDKRVNQFRLLQTRKMRPGELHYLDHPLFGVLVKVTPYQFDVAEKK